MRKPAAAVTLLAALCLTAPAAAQGKPATPAKSHPAAALRQQCAEALPLCVAVPAAWQRLGDLYDGLGFVVAEPTKDAAQDTWPQISVAAIDAPPVKAGAPPRSLDSMVELMLTPDGSFRSAETEQRSHLLLNGADAEIIRVRLHGAEGQPDKIEELALIDGDEEMVFAIVLRCPPGDFARLDPIFQKLARSWQLKSDEPAPATHSPAGHSGVKPGVRQP
jgi:hypothetical protein